MRKLFFLLSMLMTAGAVVAQSGATFTTGDAQTQNKRVSPNGKWLVGESKESHTWGLDNLYGYASYLENLETGERKWMTEFDETDVEKMGSFTDVSNDGVICGVTKDPDIMFTITEMGITCTLPLNVAAVWQKDGTMTKLGIGDFSKKIFNNFADGSFAIAMSNDAKTVVGYVAAGNYANVYPCLWVYNESTKAYDFKRYAVPEGCKEAMANDVSGDGSVAVGRCRLTTAEGPVDVACYWPTPDECVLIDNIKPIPGMGNAGEATVISDNGKYIGCTLNGHDACLGIRVNDVTNEYRFHNIDRHFPYFNAVIGGVSDDGEMIGRYEYPMTSTYRPFYYNHNTLINTDFDYYVYLYAGDVDIPFTFTHYNYENVSFSGMSANGDVIAGNNLFGEPWVLTTSSRPTLWCPSPMAFTVRSTALGEVTVAVERYSDVHMFYNAKEYVFFRDGKEVGRVAVADLDSKAKTVEFVDKDVSAGNHYYTVAINWLDGRDDTEVLSPKCEEVALVSESTYELPFFDDFSSPVSTKGWNIEKHFGDTEIQTVGNIPYFGLSGTSYLHMPITQSQPYSYALTSRHMDATGMGTVYLSFARKWNFMNTTDQDVSKDVVSVEVSTDNVSWKEVACLRPDKIERRRWSFEYIDISEYAAGKVFQVRLRPHGEAAAVLLWSFDNIHVDDKPAHAAINGGMGINVKDEGFRMTWKKSGLNAYSLNYYGNGLWNVVDMAIGNDGEELIAINKFEPSDLKMYVGKYLTSITTDFYYYDIENSKPLRAALMVYENGKLIREQEIKDLEYNTYRAYKLDEPLQIKDNVELWVGVKLIEHDPVEWPILYQNTSSFADGKSNIYSEDGGQTWLNLADYYEQVPGHETEGYASWLITANVTDTPEMTETMVDLDEFGVEVYKNGEKYTTLAVENKQGWFTDPESQKGDRYQLRAFYMSDGTCSEMSAEFENDGTTGIVEIGASEDGGEGCILDGETLLINGDNERVALYNEAGMKLYEGSSSSLDLRGYGKGLLILKVWGKDGSEHSYKIMF